MKNPFQKLSHSICRAQEDSKHEQFCTFMINGLLFEKSIKYGQITFGNTPRAKWILMLGKNESHSVIVHAERHGECPEYFGEVPNV